MAYHRATRAEIDLNAYRQNIALVRSALGARAKIMAVVKADAYGHGAIPCAEAALRAGVEHLGVGIIEEGVELRRHGITAPILVMGGIFADEAPDLVQYGLATTVCTPEIAAALARAAEKLNKTAALHIKIDTGMNRLGVAAADFQKLAQQIASSPGLRIDGLCTHFSSADEEDSSYTLRQWSLFQETLARLQPAAPFPLLHCANSSAILRYPETWLNMVRPGLLLYGALPSPALKPCLRKFADQPEERMILRPVMQWKSRIILLKRAPKGSLLSYGGRHVTQRDSLIATLPLGYADGLNRRLSGKMEVLVRGRRAPQAGTICMDMCLIDVTDIPDAAAGDEAVIFGQQGGESITVEEVAAKADTIPYEILCHVGKRVPRIYCGD